MATRLGRRSFLGSTQMDTRNGARRRGLAFLGLVAVLACGQAASADTHFTLRATFTDGATATGYIDFNGSGYIAAYDVVTTAGGPFAGFDFRSTTQQIGAATLPNGPGTTSVTLFAGGYSSDQLHLFTTLPLTTTSKDNILLASSYECQKSFGCPATTDVRYVAAPAQLGTPEPGAWALMLLGVGAVGAAGRNARRTADRRAAKAPI